MKIIAIEPTFEAWRIKARSLLEDKIHFDNIVWQTSTRGSLLDFVSDPPRERASLISIPREFIQEAHIVAAFRDDTTWSLLYRLVYRIVYEKKNLMENPLDDDVLDFRRRMKQVDRDLHKMKAFVRFREIQNDDGFVYMAWHRSDHRVLKFAAPFFKDRFNGMNWVIFTEDESMSWMNNKLSFGPGISQKEAEAYDEMEELWKTYYASIFNPARLKVKMMKQELPVRHWKTLPEAQIIDQLISEAPRRLDEFYEAQKRSAYEWIPKSVSELSELKAALPSCAACSICSRATAPVFGEGPRDARIVFVGEQPGNEEDKEGRPFVGPAGKLFMSALEKANLRREDVYVTNAVKAFKWKGVNEMRKYMNPSASEIAACRPWVKSELEMIKPLLLVCLGASAAQSVFGKVMKVGESHGKIFKTSYSDHTIILSHPSAILRAEDPLVKERLWQQLLSGIMQARITADGLLSFS